jgi:hypothetical protein
VLLGVGEGRSAGENRSDKDRRAYETHVRNSTFPAVLGRNHPPSRRPKKLSIDYKGEEKDYNRSAKRSGGDPF